MGGGLGFGCDNKQSITRPIGRRKSHFRGWDPTALCKGRSIIGINLLGKQTCDDQVPSPPIDSARSPTRQRCVAPIGIRQNQARSSTCLWSTNIRDEIKMRPTRGIEHTIVRRQNERIWLSLSNMRNADTVEGLFAGCLKRLAGSG